MNSYTISERVVKKLVRDEEFPWLISFPRTGSHWLRMLMELYFDRPSLVRVFFLKPAFKQRIFGYKATDITCYHRHDLDLEYTGLNNVLYLYRNPVATIYSLMSYHEEDLKNRERVMYWAEKYSRHLEKWLLKENFSKKKTIITYENMCSDLDCVFEDICDFFGVKFDSLKLSIAKEQVSKDRLKDKTKHDDKVVNLSDSYTILREQFKNDYSGVIYEHLASVDARYPKRDAGGPRSRAAQAFVCRADTRALQGLPGLGRGRKPCSIRLCETDRIGLSATFETDPG